MRAPDCDRTARSCLGQGQLLSATCDFSADAALRAHLEELAPVVLTQGFIASDQQAIPCCWVAAALILRLPIWPPNCRRRRLEIWTDVPGMFSANPRSTPAARLLRALHYDEAQEIASSGAKVLHPRCIMPAQAGADSAVGLRHADTGTGRHHISASGADGPPRSRPSASRRASRWCRWTARACGMKSDSWPMPSRSSSVTACPSTRSSTSETNVTVSLDPGGEPLDQGSSRP